MVLKQYTVFVGILLHFCMPYRLDALTLAHPVTSLIALRNESSSWIEASFDELALFCVSC